MTVTSPAPTTVGTLVLAHDAASVPLARTRLADALARQDLSRDTVDDALLVLSELAGNAVRHAAPCAQGVEVRWSVQPGWLLLEVVDGGGGQPRALDPDPGAVSGRGMAIVDALARGWGTEHLADGRRAVWARIAS